MRLAPCQHCHRPVVDTARFCPHCGVRNPHKPQQSQPNLPPPTLPRDDGVSVLALFAGTACAGATVATLVAAAVTIGVVLVTLVAIL